MSTPLISIRIDALRQALIILLLPSKKACIKRFHVSVQAQESYEKAMEKARKEHERSNVSPAIFPEYQLWEDHWIRWDFWIPEGSLVLHIKRASRAQNHNTFIYILRTIDCSNQITFIPFITILYYTAGHPETTIFEEYNEQTEFLCIFPFYKSVHVTFFFADS